MQKSSSFAFGAKTYYRPIEAAIRWAGLLRFEQRILETVGDRPLPKPDEFPRWPLLRLYTDRIYDGIAHGELIYGKGGVVRGAVKVEVDDPALTIRHVDLKDWVARYYPGEKPSFLFDEIERALHPAINPHALNVLLAEREATKVELTELKQAHENLRTAHDALVKDHAVRIAECDSTREPGPRSESTYLNIIGGLLTLLLGKSPSGTAYSSFRNLDAVVSALLAHHEGRPGLSERTLWSKLAQARRHLDTSR
ncbi:MAG: receptor protein-tyrosine kinase [Burkholderiales bacterium RIFCSPHIGHO2_01_FULL_64_960]|nr:MAG: receptor protein-tyrosine kinase [Burkholderiales bacterium RIFCSPHIGHO2_01_FULL_64_960]